MNIRRLFARRITIVLTVASGILLLAIILLPSVVADSFARPGIIRGFARAYPGYSLSIAATRYSLWQNRFGCDSVVVRNTDGDLVASSASLTLTGLAWWRLLSGGGPAPEAVDRLVVDASSVTLAHPGSLYDVRCLRARFSVPDSLIALDSLAVFPHESDEDFFAQSTFRKTRFALGVPAFKVSGLEGMALLTGGGYRVRSISLRDPFLSVLINKDLPVRKDSARMMMPADILATITDTLRIDSVIVTGAVIRYGERFAVGGTPAMIMFDSMHILATGIRGGDSPGLPLAVHVEGVFMSSGKIDLSMSIPLGSPDCSYEYSGTVSAMPVSSFNCFLEKAEQIRLTEGNIEAANFTVAVRSGRATGSVRAVYRGLTLAAINKRTGSQSGFVDGLTSFVANTFTIRRNNLPDRTGQMKIGRVKYSRKADDPFFRLSWFALRSGLKDVVGF